RLAVFADAYIRCKQLLNGQAAEGDSWPWHLRMLRSRRPACQLGAFAWRHHGPIAPSEPDLDVRSEVALIRSPRFVVTYLSVPGPPSGQSTSGTFIADHALDEQFAEAEPPTHDEWIPAKGRKFSPVRRVLGQIADELRPRPASGVSRDGQEEPGVVSVA